MPLYSTEPYVRFQGMYLCRVIYILPCVPISHSLLCTIYAENSGNISSTLSSLPLSWRPSDNRNQFYVNEIDKLTISAGLFTEKLSIFVWINNHIHYDVWDEITYPFPNFNDTIVDVLEWKINLMWHFMRHMIYLSGNGYFPNYPLAEIVYDHSVTYTIVPHDNNS